MNGIVKLDSIKTEAEAFEVLDMWHNRAKRLMQYAYRRNSTRKIVKAYMLQSEMMQRIMVMRNAVALWRNAESAKGGFILH